MGKLALYSACAGIHPGKTLPVVLDVGTNNEEKLKDPLYLGLKQNRITPVEEKSFVDEFMAETQKRWPGVVVQFEDVSHPHCVKCEDKLTCTTQFSTELAFDLLADHREQYPTFNDDIQGTAAVSLAGLINAIAQSGTPLKEQRIVFFGAGSAGVGIARLIAEWFVQQGVDEQTSKDMITLVDSKGLVANNRGDKLPSHKVFFSKTSPSAPKLRTLYEVVDHYRPTCLLGLSTVKSAFNERVLKKMAELNRRPIVFALSNPLTQAECTFEEAVQWTNGNVLFASGSPFPNVTWQNRALVNNQGECASSFSSASSHSPCSQATMSTSSLV